MGIFDRLTLISDDILKKPEPILEQTLTRPQSPALSPALKCNEGLWKSQEQTEDWALVYRSHVVFTRNMEISGQEINTYKPFYNYINIDLYLYVKSSHYVLFKTRVGDIKREAPRIT